MIFISPIFYTFLNIYSELYNTLCFNSHLINACEIWSQNQNNTLFQRISRLQEKALRIINFKRHDTSSDPLFKENKIPKICKIHFVKLAFKGLNSKNQYMQKYSNKYSNNSPTGHVSSSFFSLIFFSYLFFVAVVVCSQGIILFQQGCCWWCSLPPKLEHNEIYPTFKDVNCMWFFV